jgi:prevent-host-death family protein
VFVSSPNLKGAIAEAEIAAAAIRLGIPVYAPVAEHGRSDLVLEIGGRPLRTQCKWGRLDRRRGVIKVTLQTSRCTPSGYVRTSYTADEIDAVAAYCDELDRCYLLPTELVVDRREIDLRLDPARNGQRACLNLAARYEFTGAIAQLGERVRGTHEGAGSSPAGSTRRSGSLPEQIVGANRFRNHFGYYMERAAGGEDILVTRHGKPFVRLTGALGQRQLPPARAA